MLPDFLLEKAKEIQFSRDIQSLLDGLSDAFKDSIPSEIIPMLKLAFNKKSFNANRLSKLAYIAYTSYLLLQMSKIEAMIKMQNEKLENLLNVQKL